MTGRSFFDTNVLVYCDSNDEPEKQAVALRWFEETRRARRAVVSTQVVQEYFSTLTSKLAVPIETARRKIGILGSLDVVVNGLPQIYRAIDLRRLHSVSFWDGLIIAAAQEARCRVLLSEDLQHGRRFDSLEVVNPFL